MPYCLLDNGELYTFGNNSAGQVGSESSNSKPPARIPQHVELEPTQNLQLSLDLEPAIAKTIRN